MKKIWNKLWKKTEVSVLPPLQARLLQFDTVSPSTPEEPRNRSTQATQFRPSITLLPGQRILFQFTANFQVGKNQTILTKVLVTNYKLSLHDDEGKSLDPDIPENNQIPLGFISKIKVDNYQGLNELFIKTKYCRIYRLFVGKDQPFRKIQDLISCGVRDSFALSYCKSIGARQIQPFHFLKELERQQAPVGTTLRAVNNLNGNVCSTYGSIIVVPAPLSEEELIRSSKHRSKERVPSLTYYWKQTGKFIFRSSQNLVGMINKRSPQDEKAVFLLGEIGRKGKVSKTTCHIYDARPKFNALGNKMAGKGFQYPEYYSNCSIFFLDIDNIHAVRDSFGKMLAAAQREQGFHRAVGQSGWLRIIAMILLGARKIVESLEQDFNVLVHCSDGWDRTSQLCALAQVILDPFFRTFEGFKVLVRKDWLYFGHMFATRHGFKKGGDEDQMSPIFTQFLDCVHQLQSAYPLAFQFNLAYLCHLDHQTRAAKFGDFLLDTQLERMKLDVHLASVWDQIDQRKEQFRNPFYQRCEEKLDFESRAHRLRVWVQLFCVRDVSFRDQAHTFKGVRFNSQNMDFAHRELRELLLQSPQKQEPALLI